MIESWDIFIETTITYWVGVFALYIVKPYPIHFFNNVTSTTQSRSPVVSLLNQMIVHGSLTLLFPQLPQTMNQNMITDIYSVPLAMFTSSAMFYYIHRLFHIIPYIRKFHLKYHHQWMYVEPIDAFDCHIIEHIFLNIVTLFVPALVFDVSIYSFRIMIHFAIISSLLAHFNWEDTMFTNSFHKIHHLEPNVNFGQGTTLFDRLHKTWKKK